MADVLDLAEQAAKEHAGKFGGEWREYYGAAWEKAAGCKGDEPAVVLTAARRGIIDSYRDQEKTRRKNRQTPYQFFEDKGRDEGGEGRGENASLWVEDHRRPDDPRAAMLREWADAKPQRAGWGLRARVVVYLYAVEGLTMKEVGDALGFSESRIFQIVTACTGGRDAAEEEGAAPDAGGPVARAAGLGDPDAGDAAGGVGEAGPELQPAGRVAGAGDDPGRDPGDGGCSPDAGRVGDGGGGEARRGRVGEVGRGAAELRHGAGGAGAGGAGEAVEAGDRGAGAGPVPADGKTTALAGRRGAGVAQLIIPPPGETGRKAAALRERMFDAVGSADIDDVMGVLVRKAKAGDLRAIGLLFSTLGAKK